MSLSSSLPTYLNGSPISRSPGIEDLLCYSEPINYKMIEQARKLLDIKNIENQEKTNDFHQNLMEDNV